MPGPHYLLSGRRTGLSDTGLIQMTDAKPVSSGSGSDDADPSVGPSKSEACGIVMPISETDGLDKQHWIDVREILFEAAAAAGFSPQLVSDSDDVGVIQKRIIQNLYDNPIVVCDVSGKNPNVMFELGMRLAFDKPTVIVKDDVTAYSFDTAPIEHLEYPRDLRFQPIIDFKARLGQKLRGSLRAARADAGHTTFLGHFGTFAVARLDEKEVDVNEFILEELRSLSSRVSALSHQRPAHHSEEVRMVEGAAAMKQGMLEFSKERDLRGKRVMRAHEQEVHRTLIRDPSITRYYPSKKDFEDSFRVVFDTLYG